MDDFDRASETEEFFRSLALKNRVIESCRESADCCVECGELIPSERQIAIRGVQTCVDCQSYLDQHRGKL
jgi:phage/conjugal plasmid C-4 type zinc finger TraR family protein